MYLEALGEELLVEAPLAVDDYVLLALRMRGEMPGIAATLAARSAWLERRGLESPSIADSGVTEDDLHAWYTARFGAVGESWDEHARRLGFASYRDFAIEILECFLFERDSGASDQRS
jgi:hypothetical protein